MPLATVVGLFLVWLILNSIGDETYEVVGYIIMGLAAIAGCVALAVYL